MDYSFKRKHHRFTQSIMAVTSWYIFAAVKNTSQKSFFSPTNGLKEVVKLWIIMKNTAGLTQRKAISELYALYLPILQMVKKLLISSYTVSI